MESEEANFPRFQLKSIEVGRYAIVSFTNLKDTGHPVLLGRAGVRFGGGNDTCASELTELN